MTFIISNRGIGGRSSQASSAEESVPLLGTLTLRPDDVVVVLGDSITGVYTWYGPLEDEIGEILAGLTFHNAGVSGEIMNQLLARVGDVIAHEPDVVMIEAGINDAALDVAPATTAEKLEDIMDALLLDNPAVRLMVLGPCCNGLSIADNATNQKIRATNDAMRDVAVAYGVAFVDWRGHFELAVRTDSVNVTTLFVDGVHPSDAGKEWLSEKAMLQTTLAA